MPSEHPLRRRRTHFTLHFPASPVNPSRTQLSVPLADMRTPPLHALATSAFMESRTHSAVLPSDCPRSFILLARYLASRPLSLRSHPALLPLVADKWDAPPLLHSTAVHFCRAHAATTASTVAQVRYWLALLRLLRPAAFPATLPHALCLRLAHVLPSLAGDSEDLVDALRQANLLPLATRYITRFAATPDNPAHLLALLAALRRNVGLRQRDELLAWAAPSLRDSWHKLEPDPIALGSVVSVFGDAVGLPAARLRAVWQLAGVGCRVRGAPRFRSRARALASGGALIDADVSCANCVAWFLAPLCVRVRVRAGSGDVPPAGTVCVVLDVVEDGCVCGVWGRGGARVGKTMRKRVDARELQSDGVEFRPFDGAELMCWTAQHRGGCGFVFVVRVMDRALGADGDVEEEEQVGVGEGWGNDDEGVCRCETCSWDAVDRQEELWDTGIDMSGPEDRIFDGDEAPYPEEDEDEGTDDGESCLPCAAGEEGREDGDKVCADVEDLVSLCRDEDEWSPCPCGGCS